MKTNKDIRWEQRFSNYVRALQKLTDAVNYVKSNQDANDTDEDEILDEILREGLIQRFEYTHELAWNVMKDYIAFQGNPNAMGSRDATREAFQLQLIEDGQVWMDMIGSRNKTSHTYNEETARDIYNKVLNDYYPAFLAFQANMEALRSGQQGGLFEL